MILNSGRRRLEGGEGAVVIGTSQQAVDSALSQDFFPAPPLKGAFADLEQKDESPLQRLVTLGEVRHVTDSCTNFSRQSFVCMVGGILLTMLLVSKENCRAREVAAEKAP